MYIFLYFLRHRNPKSYPYPINVTNDENLLRSHRILQGGPRIAASFIQQKDTKQRDTKTGFF